MLKSYMIRLIVIYWEQNIFISRLLWKITIKSQPTPLLRCCFYVMSVSSTDEFMVLPSSRHVHFLFFFCTKSRHVHWASSSIVHRSRLASLAHCTLHITNLSYGIHAHYDNNSYTFLYRLINNSNCWHRDKIHTPWYTCGGTYSYTYLTCLYISLHVCTSYRLLYGANNLFKVKKQHIHPFPFLVQCGNLAF